MTTTKTEVSSVTKSLEEIRAQADYECPYQIIRTVMGQPDPVKLEALSVFGHFIRYPLRKGENVWCFESEIDAAKFKSLYGGTTKHV